MLVLNLLGQRMADVCWDVQRAGVYRSAETPSLVAWNTIREAMPDRDDSGGLRLWHCTTVENGLRIMQDAQMRVLGRTTNRPQGTYSAKSPAETYDIGCQVGLRVAGVIASKTVGSKLAKSPEMCPLGLIVVLKRPEKEEWVVHPQG